MQQSLICIFFYFFCLENNIVRVLQDNKTGQMIRVTEARLFGPSENLVGGREDRKSI